MNFPTDIWNLIMSYFHSSYKKCGHYNAIMMINEFYFTRMHHRHNFRYSSTWNRSLMVDSFYMRVILSQQRNTTIRYPEPVLNRGVARGWVAREFKEIYGMYRVNCLGNYLDDLVYV